MYRILLSVAVSFFVLPVNATQRLLVNKIIARINDKSVYLSSLQERRIVKNGKPYSFDELITEELLCQRAVEMGFVLNKQEIESSISSFKIVNNLAHLTDEEFDNELRNNIGIGLTQYKDQITRLLTAQRIQYYEVNHKVVITAQEVEDFCKNNPEYNEEEIHIKLLMLDEQLEKLTHEQLKLIKDWQDLGWFSKQELDPVFVKAIEGLQDGQISSPIQHEGIEQVVMLVQKNPRHLKPVEYRYASVERILHEEKLARVGDEFGLGLRSKAVITFPK